MHFREASLSDTDAIRRLYKKVAASEGGLARTESEITEDYVTSFVKKSVEAGMIIVCEHPEDPGELVAEIHAYKNGLTVFAHVMGDLTLVVHPDFRRQRIGRTILTIFLNEIAKSKPDIAKVELISRESNVNAISLYQSLGFRIEGRMEIRIKTPEGQYEADIPMGWQNPSYEF